MGRGRLVAGETGGPVRDTIKAVLEADTELVATLTGGVYTETISRQRTPDAFDAHGEIQPCALIRVERDAQHGPFTGTDALSARTYVVVYAYQLAGYSSIDTALNRVRVLLHRSRLGAGTWDISWADDSADLEDEGLRCAMRFSRYVVTRKC